MWKRFKIHILVLFGSFFCDLASYNRYHNGLRIGFQRWLRYKYVNNSLKVLKKLIESGHVKGLKNTINGLNSGLLNQYMDYSYKQLEKLRLNDPNSLRNLSRKIEKSYRFRFWRYRNTMKPTLAKIKELTKNKIEWVKPVSLKLKVPSFCQTESRASLTTVRTCVFTKKVNMSKLIDSCWIIGLPPYQDKTFIITPNVCIHVWLFKSRNNMNAVR